MFAEALLKVQSLQREYATRLSSFSVVVKYDDYYEEYFEVEIRTDTEKFFFTTYSCVYEEEYRYITKEIGNTLKELYHDGE